MVFPPHFRIYCLQTNDNLSANLCGSLKCKHQFFNDIFSLLCLSTVYYAKIGGFLCYIAPFLIVLFNDKMLDLILPVFNSAVLLKGLTLFDIYGMKGAYTNSKKKIE